MHSCASHSQLPKKRGPQKQRSSLTLLILYIPKALKNVWLEFCANVAISLHSLPPLTQILLISSIHTRALHLPPAPLWNLHSSVTTNIGGQNPCHSECGLHGHDLRACWRYRIPALPGPNEPESTFDPDPKVFYTHTLVWEALVYSTVPLKKSE